MFALKKIVGACLMPLTLALGLLICGALLRVMGRRRAALAACWTAIGVAWLAALGAVGNGLLWPLESRYPPLGQVTTDAEPPRYIVVLGSGYRPRYGLPITSTLDSAGLTRIVEGVRLWRQIPSASLVVSGGAYGAFAAAADGYALAARELGVPASSIIRMENPLDTEGEVIELRRVAGDQRVLLVTSAAHMPRAVAYCTRLGVRATAAPTGHQSVPLSMLGVTSWVVPSGIHLRQTETALHEYFGLLALRLTID